MDPPMWLRQRRSEPAPVPAAEKRRITTLAVPFGQPVGDRALRGSRKLREEATDVIQCGRALLRQRQDTECLGRGSCDKSGQNTGGAVGRRVIDGGQQGTV